MPLPLCREPIITTIIITTIINIIINQMIKVTLWHKMLQ